jgi:hypothetical protein
MEDRVRVCRNCNAIVGWVAQFCESCGAKQAPRLGASPPAAAAAAAASPAVAGGTAAVGQAPAPAVESLEREVRVHLASPPTDARTVARELFHTQLKLIDRHREDVEQLIGEVEGIKRDLSAAGKMNGQDARRAIDALSQRMFDAEQRWGEVQVSYNRESEAIEEESRESMEIADLDAYLSPDENAKVEGEYASLTGRLETVDGLLRDVGRAITLSRQSAGSRYLGSAPAGSGVRLVLLVVTLGLVAWSLYSALFHYRDDPARIASIVGPLLLALGIWVVLGFFRRDGA